MTEDKPKPKGAKAAFVSTVVGCALVFGFIVAHILIVKNAEIDLLERQVEQLSQVGAVPEAVNELKTEISDLKNQLLPLTVVTQVDPVTGRCKFGGMDSPTDLSRDLAKCLKLVEGKKYDLALSTADAMEKRLPSFLGSHYIRFLVNKEKNYTNEAASEAEILLKAESDDKRFANVYVFLINHYLSQERKKQAEELALKALALWPEDKLLSDSFIKIFGYKPTIRSDTSGTEQQ
jgi:tetratricopeptide (TPR) repeat protein